MTRGIRARSSERHWREESRRKLMQLQGPIAAFDTSHIYMFTKAKLCRFTKHEGHVKQQYTQYQNLRNSVNTTALT